jgi:hypothetical protein
MPARVRNKYGRGARKNGVYVDPVKKIVPMVTAPSTNGKLTQVGLFLPPYDSWRVTVYNSYDPDKEEQSTVSFNHPIRIEAIELPDLNPKGKRGSFGIPQWLAELEMISIHEQMHESIQKPDH